ncbi:glycosyltransferase family A protein [Agrobacterium tumefaciens]|uniref:glycosyltransferase family 2 protein n=1 Tax=Agrobacterium tumefaciens TaxID=358 RepID=UPI00287BD00B|nr:glycosyltransferase family A protein [Agrobacterium tumefaciens]MDS7594769.1 glycosyltransferase [Agrobacterium tumefaciens]
MESMQQSSPKVSVILPVYNGAELLNDAIQSVLSQTMGDFELIVLDDGSTDNTWELLQTLSDPRIRAYHHDNMGLPATLNRGISLAIGHYIARLDHDDLMMPLRLDTQARYLDANPTIALLGTAAQIYVGSQPTERYHRHPSSSKALKLRLLFDNPFVHASIMFRREAIVAIGGYCTDKSRLPPEDYELWSRIARTHDVANLEDVLTIYREVPGSLSRIGENPFLEKVLMFSTENIFAIVSPNYSMQDCRALAEIYHGVESAASRMSYRRAMRILYLAATRIADGHHDAEFLSTLQSMKRLFEFRFSKRWIPQRLIPLARAIRRRFFR